MRFPLERWHLRRIRNPAGQVTLLRPSWPQKHYLDDTAASRTEKVLPSIIPLIEPASID